VAHVYSQRLELAFARVRAWVESGGVERRQKRS
jgi:hypothetical protein